MKGSHHARPRLWAGDLCSPSSQTMCLYKLFGILFHTIFHNQLLPTFLASSSHSLSPPLQTHHTAHGYLQILHGTILSLVFVLEIAPACDQVSLPCMLNCPSTLRIVQVPCTAGSPPRMHSALRDFQVSKYPVYVPIVAFIPF